MGKELAEVDYSQIQSSCIEEADSTIEASSREPLDQFNVAPMDLQDHLFSIVSILPRWTYAGSMTKVYCSGGETFFNFFSFWLESLDDSS